MSSRACDVTRVLDVNIECSVHAQVVFFFKPARLLVTSDLFW